MGRCTEFDGEDEDVKGKRRVVAVELSVDLGMLRVVLSSCLFCCLCIRSFLGWENRT